jgi:hypothetical protein
MRVRAIAVLLVLFTATASADNSVDWSQYVEKPTDKPLVSHTPDVAGTASEAPVSVASSGKAAKTSKRKAPKKAKARTTKARSKKSHRK